jgi:hypothetical protein
MCGSNQSKIEPVEEGMNDIAVNRGCTDCIWLPVFGAFWIGMIIVGVIGFTMGYPEKLIYAVSKMIYWYLRRHHHHHFLFGRVVALFCF